MLTSGEMLMSGESSMSGELSSSDELPPPMSWPEVASGHVMLIKRVV